MKKLYAVILLLVSSISWALEKDQLKEELKYWKSLLDDGLITQEDYDNKKNELLYSEISTKEYISEDNQKSELKENNQNKYKIYGYEVTEKEVFNIQLALKNNGYKVIVDGKLGPKTLEAINKWVDCLYGYNEIFTTHIHENILKYDSCQILAPDTNENGFIFTHLVSAGRGITVNGRVLDKGTKLMLIPGSCKRKYEDDYICAFKTEDDFRFSERTYYFEEVGYSSNYDQNLTNENISNTSSNDNNDYTEKNESKKDSSSNYDPVANQLKKQNELLEQQLNFNKKQAESERNRRIFNNFLNLLSPQPNYNNNSQLYCRNYGTANHPNVVCSPR